MLTVLHYYFQIFLVGFLAVGGFLNFVSLIFTGLVDDAYIKSVLFNKHWFFLFVLLAPKIFKTQFFLIFLLEILQIVK